MKIPKIWATGFVRIDLPTLREIPNTTKLACEVEFSELTADDQLRQTTFLGWREDKNPKGVVLELR